MEILVLDGKNYVKASKAARDLGYATDYVGQLCRSGQVDAHLIGRTWYVNQDDLDTHKVEKKRSSRVKAREYAKKTIEEHRKKQSETPKVYKNIDIQYESDSESLIPETRKISVTKESPKHPNYYEHDTGGGFEVVNKGNKVKMTGTINVVDVTDGPIDPDTTVLTPTIRRLQTKEVKEFTRPKIKEIEPEPYTKPTFRERLGLPEENESVESEGTAVAVQSEMEQSTEVHLDTLDEAMEPTEQLEIAETGVGEEIHNEAVFMQQPEPAAQYKEVAPEVDVVPEHPSLLGCAAVLLVVTLVVLATIPVETIFTYESNRPGILQTTFSYSIDEAFVKIASKI